MLGRVGAIALVLALAVGLTGCVLRPVESADRRTETRDVTGFDSIEFAGFGELEIVQGPEYALEISGPGDVLDRTLTEVRGDRLRIGHERFWPMWWFGAQSRTIEVRVTVPDLRRLDVSGAGDVILEGLSGDSLELRLSGAGQIAGEDLEYRELEAVMSGAGSISATGEVETQSVRMSGVGEFDGRDLRSREASVELSGAGNATVWVTDSLDVRVSGAGSVDHYGNPQVDSQTSGAGSITNRGDR